MPVTIIAAERLNELNISCPKLLKLATELPIPNLPEAEIYGLLELLEKHNALGFLSGKSRDDHSNLAPAAPALTYRHLKVDHRHRDCPGELSAATFTWPDR